MKNFEKLIDSLTSGAYNIEHRIVVKNSRQKICLLFIKQITDRLKLSEYLIKPILQYDEKISSEVLINNVILVDNCTIETDQSKILGCLLDGRTIILLSNDEQFIITNIKKVEKKQIESPELTYTVRGPKDCFNENMDDNISLIRYRVKDPQLRIDFLEIGRRTKTKVAIAYINDIVNKDYVTKINDSIKKIDTDGIHESGTLQHHLLNNKFNLFPQMGIIERSDMASTGLLEGKVIILTEGSCIGLVAPRTINEFITSCDDNYDNKYFGLLSKIFRFIAIFMSFTITPLYVAVVSFGTDVLPGEYIITLANTRAGVPFTALTEALILEFIIEVLREALLRVPKQIGPAIGIVGAIIIGQAAIAAGIFSPLILIIASLALLTSFVSPDYTIVNPLRVIKFIAIMATGILGLFGLTLTLVFVTISLISTHSLGVPFMAPYSPFNWYDFTRSLMHNQSISPNRPNFLGDNDNTRSNSNKNS